MLAASRVSSRRAMRRARATTKSASTCAARRARSRIRVSHALRGLVGPVVEQGVVVAPFAVVLEELGSGRSGSARGRRFHHRDHGGATGARRLECDHVAEDGSLAEGLAVVSATQPRPTRHALDARRAQRWKGGYHVRWCRDRHDLARLVEDSRRGAEGFARRGE